MTWIIWVLACAEPRDWTREGAMAPMLARMDGDRDGRVAAAEYAPYAGPPFAELDTDGDGTLEAPELVAYTISVEPHGFDGASPRRPPSPEGARAAFPRPWEERVEADRAAFLAGPPPP